MTGALRDRADEGAVWWLSLTHLEDAHTTTWRLRGTQDQLRTLSEELSGGEFAVEWHREPPVQSVDAWRDEQRDLFPARRTKQRSDARESRRRRAEEAKAERGRMVVGDPAALLRDAVDAHKRQHATRIELKPEYGAGLDWMEQHRARVLTTAMPREEVEARLREAEDELFAMKLGWEHYYGGHELANRLRRRTNAATAG
jgi:hypothetical protein